MQRGSCPELHDGARRDDAGCACNDEAERCAVCGCRPDRSRPERESTSAPIPSDVFLHGRRMVEINHNGTIYRLHATRAGKLILTK